ncbi:hypothetical protein [Saccharopolyspora griseoalba]|uniref:Uncharacterized protein n=1 Tax=Saccharopolyspora griseoalba TaxID=1431848 RepID=A0ABW2LHA3_9PSEU
MNPGSPNSSGKKRSSLRARPGVDLNPMTALATSTASPKLSSERSAPDPSMRASWASEALRMSSR